MPKMSDYPDRGTLLDDDIFTVAADDTYKITYGDMKAQIIEGVDAGEGGGSTLPEGEAGQFPVNVGGNDVEFRFITGSDLTDALDELGISAETLPADFVTSVNGETGAVFVTTDSIGALDNDDPDAIVDLLATLSDEQKNYLLGILLLILQDDQVLVMQDGSPAGLDFQQVPSEANSINHFDGDGAVVSADRSEHIDFIRDGLAISTQSQSGTFSLAYSPNVNVYDITLTGNATLDEITDFPDTGFAAELNIKQDAVGGHTFAVNESNITRWADVALAVDTTASATTQYMIKNNSGLGAYIYRIGVA